MRKHLLLALPLASVLMLAGCSCGTGTCSIPAEDCNTCPTIAPAVIAAPVGVVAQPSWEYVKESSDPVLPSVTKMTTEEYQKLLSSGMIREVAAAAPKADVVVAAKPEFKPAVVEVAPVVAQAPAVAPVKAPVASTVKASSSVPHIPAMSLPKGYDYIHEQDLSGGALNTIAVDQYYTQATSKHASRFNIEDI